MEGDRSESRSAAACGCHTGGCGQTGVSREAAGGAGGAAGGGNGGSGDAFAEGSSGGGGERLVARAIDAGNLVGVLIQLRPGEDEARCTGSLSASSFDRSARDDHDADLDLGPGGGSRARRRSRY